MAGMRIAALLGWGLAFLTGLAGAQQAPAPAARAPVLVLQLQGAIGPASAEQVRHGLQQAQQQGAQLLVLRLDTPGGLDAAMRDIIKDMLASPVPVAVFVAPSGARAASAGTYILYASHVAAMAPATNLGAATPIAIGLPSPGAAPSPAPSASSTASAAAPADHMEAKRIHDAAAYMRALARLRQRNADWGERAVREAVSLAAHEALEQHVIDLVATDLPDLLRRLDGRRLDMPAGRVTLATAGATVVTVDLDWRGKLLAAISDPSLALMLLMLGIYGLLFEFMNPGFVLPGVAGGVSLLLAMWGLQMLPVNYAGLALIALGIAFFVAEAFVPSYGTLGMGGIAAFAFGALLLIDSDLPDFSIPRPLIAGLALLSAGAVLAIARMAARAHRRPVVSGAPALIGAAGELIESEGQQGWALVQGERWRVRAAQPLSLGQQVRVTGQDGLTLEVEADRSAAQD
jgi:membrane-bound serine protease (ClpP class)